jgi:hypothetical protein
LIALGIQPSSAHFRVEAKAFESEQHLPRESSEKCSLALSERRLTRRARHDHGAEVPRPGRKRDVHGFPVGFAGACRPACCRHVDTAFAGVDVIYGADGRPSVLEVNSMPAWAGVQKVTPANIAAELAADLVAALGRARMRQALP